MNPTRRDYRNKELVLSRITDTNSLSLRMTTYIYPSDFLYERVFRIRNNFNISTSIGYYD